MSVDRLRLGVVRIGVSVLVAGAVIGVAGCTGNDPAPTSTSTTSSSTTTSSPPTTTTSPPPTTGATDLPAAAKAHTPAGAEAFVQFFFKQLVLAWTRPDPALLTPLCDEGSKSCAAFKRTASDLATSKQKYDAAPLEVTSLSYTGTDASDLRVEMKGAQTESHIVSASGGVVESFKREPSHLAVYVRWAGTGWIVHDIKVVAE